LKIVAGTTLAFNYFFMRVYSLLVSLLLIPFANNAQVSSVKLTVHIPSIAESKNVYVAGSFNNWKAGDSLYRMKKEDDATYSIILPVFKDAPYQYKYTLGKWDDVEVASNDSNIKNRNFISTGKKKKITDTVVKWASPKPAAQKNISPQMLKINAMKDSVLKGLQPKLDEMLQLLRQYTVNLLQQNPSIETDNRITADVVKHFTVAYGSINSLLHKVFESLSPGQKQKILKAVSTPGADKDFINTLGAAFNDVMK
jgi:hypothetical protein